MESDDEGDVFRRGESLYYDAEESLPASTTPAIFSSSRQSSIESGTWHDARSSFELSSPIARTPGYRQSTDNFQDAFSTFDTTPPALFNHSVDLHKHFNIGFNKDENGTNGLHIIVLVPGLYGRSSDLRFVSELFDELSIKRDGVLKIETFRPNSNNFPRSYDGIKTCGNRLFEELVSYLRQREKEGVTIKLVSFIAMSIGGLFVRWCVGRMLETGIIGKENSSYKLDSYVSVATPHAGIRRNNSDWLGSVTNFLLDRIADSIGGLTARQSALLDKPFLLARMASPSSLSYQGMAKFRNIYTYANISGDRVVSYVSAAVARVNPYKSLKSIPSPMKSFPGIVRDEDEQLDQDVPLSDFNLNPLALQGSIMRSLEMLPWTRIDVSLPGVFFDTHAEIQGGIRVFCNIYVLFVLFKIKKKKLDFKDAVKKYRIRLDMIPKEYFECERDLLSMSVHQKHSSNEFSLLHSDQSQFLEGLRQGLLSVNKKQCRHSTFQNLIYQQKRRKPL
eukprot:UC4_evm8s1434